MGLFSAYDRLIPSMHPRHDDSNSLNVYSTMPSLMHNTIFPWTQGVLIGRVIAQQMLIQHMIANGSDLDPLGIPLPDYYYALFFSYPMFLLSPFFPAYLPLSQSANAINPISFVTTTAAMVQFKKRRCDYSKRGRKRYYWKEIVFDAYMHLQEACFVQEGIYSCTSWTATTTTASPI